MKLKKRPALKSMKGGDLRAAGSMRRRDFFGGGRRVFCRNICISLIFLTNVLNDLP